MSKWGGWGSNERALIRSITAEGAANWSKVRGAYSSSQPDMCCAGKRGVLKYPSLSAQGLDSIRTFSPWLNEDSVPALVT